MEPLSRRTFIRRAALAASSVGIMPVLAACTGATPAAITATEPAATASPAAAVQAAPTLKGEITFAQWSWTGESFDNGLGQIIENYKQVQPDVGVKVVDIPADSARTWLNTQFAGELTPDIVQISRGWAWSDGPKGFIIRMDPLFELTSPYTGQKWIDSFDLDWHNSQRNSAGEIHIVSVYRTETGFYYNQDIFDEAGLEAPETWDEFTGLCKTLQDAGIDPVVVPNKAAQAPIWLLIPLGDNLMRPLVPEMNTLRPADNYVDQEELVRALKLGLWQLREPPWTECWTILKDWSQYWVKGFNGLGPADARPIFLQGKAAMYFDTTSAFAAIDTDKDRQFRYGVFPVPTLTKDTSAYASDAPTGNGRVAYSFSIAKTAEKRGSVEAATDFLMFLSTTESMEIFSKIQVGIPLVKGVATAEVLKQFEGKEPNQFNWYTTAEAEDAVHKSGQLYYAGELSHDEMIEHQAQAIEEAADLLIEQNGWTF